MRAFCLQAQSFQEGYMRLKCKTDLLVFGWSEEAFGGPPLQDLFQITSTIFLYPPPESLRCLQPQERIADKNLSRSLQSSARAFP